MKTPSYILPLLAAMGCAPSAVPEASQIPEVVVEPQQEKPATVQSCRQQATDALAARTAETQDFPHSYTWEIQASEEIQAPEVIAWEKFSRDYFVQPFDMGWEQARDLAKQCFVLKRATVDKCKLQATFDYTPVGNQTLKDGMRCRRMDIVQAHGNSFQAMPPDEQYSTAWLAAIRSPEILEAMLEAKYFNPDMVTRENQNPLTCLAIPNTKPEALRILVKYGARKDTVCNGRNWGWSDGDINLLELARKRREIYAKGKKPDDRWHTRQFDRIIGILTK